MPGIENVLHLYAVKKPFIAKQKMRHRLSQSMNPTRPRASMARDFNFRVIGRFSEKLLLNA